MHVTIDGHTHTLIDLKTFRRERDLPLTFGVAYFEPKDYTGLARIDTAGADINALRDAVLKAIPSSLTLPELLGFTSTLTELFRTQLYAINDNVNLKDVEIEFAVAGFSDVLQAHFYERMRASAAKNPPQSFGMIYGTWLNDTVRISQQTHDYVHQGATWRVNILNNAYGRFGMIVELPDETVYVADASLGCPAEGYMFNLLRDVIAKLDLALKD
ncbi:MAG: hypothetical protein RLP44_05045 [Aggregatilineales bacterium]